MHTHAHRYYAENAVEMVDSEGEFYVSRSSGILTIFSAKGHPGDRKLVLDRGDAVREGISVKSSDPVGTTLIPAGTKQNTKVVLPATAVSWGASSFSLSAIILTNSTADGQ